MRIALDAMGGDIAPAQNIGGAKLALAAYPHITKLYLVGKEDALKTEMAREKLSDPRIEIVPADEVIYMFESAVKGVRKKKNSSINVAVDLVKRGDAQAVVSAGHTGAAVVSSTLKLRTLEGVERAGIACPMPNIHGSCHLLDGGANVDSRPVHLFHYAIMGAIYRKHVLGVENPVIGLLSNGEEEGKGNELTNTTAELLKSSRLHFRGNVEGRDVFLTTLDVAVCDGFVGNVFLKGAEGLAKAMFGLIKDEASRHWRYKIGGWLVRPAIKKVQARGSYEEVGGSPLLGVNGITIIAHGSSSPLAIKNAIRAACDAVSHSINPRIEEEIARYLPATR
ncbi:MAG: phosphate acyltransferase PlsX [Verrucomicrobiales bacterium]|nr:phosphate acyltransferase PlsX [Verrucomicrobiales bacterium]